MIEIIDCDENKKQLVHDLSRQLNDIRNLKECHIFTTVMKNNKCRHIFSSYVAYDTHEKQPIIIIKRAPSKKNPPKNISDLELSNQIEIE
ncbi:10124_t:CDS:1, partial [Gigaspora margarita]